MRFISLILLLLFSFASTSWAKNYSPKNSGSSSESVYVSTPITVTSTGTFPTKDLTPVIDLSECRRDGPDWICTYRYLSDSVGVVGTGGYIFHLPAGVVIDSSIPFVSNVASASGYSGAYSAATIGSCSFNVGSGGSGPMQGLAVATSSTTFQGFDWWNVGGAAVHSASYGSFGATALGFHYYLRFKAGN